MTFSLGNSNRLQDTIFQYFVIKAFLDAYLVHLCFCTILNYSYFYIKSPNDDLFNNVILPLLDLPISN